MGLDVNHILDKGKMCGKTWSDHVPTGGDTYEGYSDIVDIRLWPMAQTFSPRSAPKGDSFLSHGRAKVIY